MNKTNNNHIMKSGDAFYAQYPGYEKFGYHFIGVCFTDGCYCLMIEKMNQEEKSGIGFVEYNWFKVRDVEFKESENRSPEPNGRRENVLTYTNRCGESRVGHIDVYVTTGTVVTLQRTGEQFTIDGIDFSEDDEHFIVVTNLKTGETTLKGRHWLTLNEFLY